MATTKIALEIPHYLRQGEALQRLRDLFFATLGTELGDNMAGLHVEWNGQLANFRLLAMGKPAVGRILVRTNLAEIHMNMLEEMGIYRLQLETALRGSAERLLKS